MLEDGMPVVINDNNPAIVKDDSKCINCGQCLKVCKDEITVAKMVEMVKTTKPMCINCGQCSNICPTEAIKEKFDYLKVKSLLKSKIKIVTFSIAPAVRVAIGEEFGDYSLNDLSLKLVTALKKIGVNYVFDVTFGADLTVMEEAFELVKRIKNSSNLPMFSSCCPSWVKYCEIFYPDLIENLSTCKSPIGMQGAIINNYFLPQSNLRRKDVINVVVAPCTAKKMEIKKFDDIDYVLTTRELAMLLKEESIDLLSMTNGKFDSPLKKGSSAGVIFGFTGGVCEAVLRTAYYFMVGKNMDNAKLVFDELRGMNGIKKTELLIGDKKIRVAVCNGMANAKLLIDSLASGNEYFDFIEVMNCNGGCIAGGGQPKMPLLNVKDIKTKRINALINKDKESKVRLCHENSLIKDIYNDFLIEPNSEIAHDLLHTSFVDRSYLLRSGELD